MHRCAVSEERLARIETALAGLTTKADLEVAIATAAAGLATKADLAQFATKADLAQFATKADLAQFATKADLAQFATKADLEGVAKNVDVTKLGANVRALMRASEAARDDMRVATAIALRLEHTLADALVQLQAMVQQQMRLGDRVRALEDEREPPPPS